VHIGGMKTQEHGLPHRRHRIYVVACHGQWKRPFTWPQPIARKLCAHGCIMKYDDDNPHRLPPKGLKGVSGANSMNRRRQIVKASHKHHVMNNVNPAEQVIITDIGCSLSRSRPGGINELHCLTATRGKSCDYWVSTRGGDHDSRVVDVCWSC